MTCASDIDFWVTDETSFLSRPNLFICFAAICGMILMADFIIGMYFHAE